MAINNYWHNRALEDFSPQEWEQLCDGCGKCCLHKLEDIDTGELFFTRVVCRLLDDQRCQCRDYQSRFQQIEGCIRVTPAIARGGSLPDSCAYRLLAEGRGLPTWHPLVTGDPQSTVNEGQSVSGWVISEEHVHEDGMDEHVIHWVKS